ncbi:MAG: N-acetyltransferase family protein [Verrucomicrobiota bacterium]
MGQVRSIRESDAPAFARIYNHYIRETLVTFEEEEIDDADALSRIREITSEHAWYVYESEDGRIEGYAYIAPFKSRCSYRYSLELSIYLDKDATGKGIGTQLMKAVLAAAQSGDCHILIGGVALPNDASVRIHEKFGFEKVAHFKEVGRKFDRWIDVAYWQKTINPIH